MLVNTFWQRRMGEQPEGRTMGYVPMVYEKVATEPVAWEYHVLTMDTRETALPDTTQLNELGKKGWILTGILDERVSGHGIRVHYYFARQRID
jgi:hypothetical protein